MHAPGVSAAHVPLGPALGERGNRLERSQFGAVRAGRQRRQFGDPGVQLLERPAEIAQGVAHAAQRATKSASPVCSDSTTSAAASTMREVELLAGVDLHHGEPGIERRLSFGADADLIPTRSSHEPLSAGLLAA